ncbi:hypothetical protein [Olsenella profusa]|uniref:Uncharacterized protein n=1 Tax=Olsenella profusa TaxID=138595 RepID=A0ABS2EZV9_9ACTN|nr:hypothetical protein [Olsenella profusa]MBM6774254.1 hypothetical protein [Olsenella profusa]
MICLAGMLVAAAALGVLAARSGRAARDVLARDRDAAVLWFVPHAILAPAATVSAAQLGVALGWLGSWAMAVLPVIVAIVEIALLCVLGDFPARLRKGEW